MLNLKPVILRILEDYALPSGGTAVFHDSRRVNEGIDDDPGQRGADLCNMDDQSATQDVVAAILREMGISVSAMRTILIQKGYFVGHKYHLDGGYATRFVGKNEIEIYDDDGKLLKTVTLEEIDKNDAA